MAGKKDNLKSLFSNARSRVIILFTVALMVLMVTVGYYKFKSSTGPAISTASVSAGPGGIQSIPGSADPTAQYAFLQEKQNIEQAQAAAKQGGSAIPTIVRSQSFGQGVEAVGPQNGKGGLGFSSLTREDDVGPQQSLWIQELKDSNCSQAAVKKVMNQGAVLTDLKMSCTCAQLRDNQFSLDELQQICSCPMLREAGFNATQLKAAGYSASRLQHCGFDACELRAAGFTAQELKDAGFSDGELKGAGFTDQQIGRVSGLPTGVTAADVRQAGCQVDALKRLRAEGVSAAAIRRTNGCSVAQLKAAGFSAKDLMAAGFTAAELKKAGFTAAQLQAAGFTARDLLNAGFTPDQLAAAGFSPSQIRSAEAELPPGITPDDVKNAGCSENALANERAEGVSAALIREYAGCSAAALKEAGFTDGDLANAGFTPQQIAAANTVVSDAAIQAAGCDPVKLKQLFLQGVSAQRIHALNGCSADALKAAGFTAGDLLNAGFTPKELLAAGFSPDQVKAAEDALDAAIRAAGCDPTQLHKLFSEGVSAQKIHDMNGCSAEALKAAGYSAKDLLNAGFTPQALKAAGFSPTDIQAAEAASNAAIRAAGCDPAKLKQLFAEGVSAQKIHDMNGCSAEALKAAGYSATDLLNAGFTPQALKAAGFSPADIQAAEAASNAAIQAAGCDPTKLKQLFAEGVSAQKIHDMNGCSAAALKAAGFDAKQLAAAGFTPQQLLAAGFTPEQLAKAGEGSGVMATNCSVSALEAARASGVSALTIRNTLGCSAAALKAAGFTAAELKAAGFTAAELKDAGFTAAQLKAAGFSASELRAAGFSAQQLKDAGFNAMQLKDAGFTAAEMKAAGFTAAQLNAAGYTAEELKKAGFSAKDLRQAGFSAKELKQAGFDLHQLKAAGFSERALDRAGFNLKQSELSALAKPDSSPPSEVVLPSIGGADQSAQSLAAANNKQLNEILQRQKVQMAEQRYQQKIQQHAGLMAGAANQALQGWKSGFAQAYVGGSGAASDTKGSGASQVEAVGHNSGRGSGGDDSGVSGSASSGAMQPLVRAGDVIFAVLDTSVNSDQPGPILATIVTGRFKGAKLIGSFNLPSNGDKMVISFNMMSVPGAVKTTPINAYAIDPNTARTALASRTNHHYLTRYGSLFAATFIEGFGNAFQSAGTTITIGGTGGAVQNTTISSGAGRSVLENAVIGLATVGKNWGQVAMQNVNTPTTVEVYSGTGLGILFTQDLMSL